MPNKTQEKLAYSTGSQPDDTTLETRDILFYHKFAFAVMVMVFHYKCKHFITQGKVNCPT